MASPNPSPTANAIGNGAVAPALKEAAAIAQDYFANGASMNLRLLSLDGTLYLTMLTEDRQGWMLFRTLSNCN